MPNILNGLVIEAYWVLAGGDPKVGPTMAAIAIAESSGDASVKQAGQPYATTGWGLWQITPGDSEPQVGKDDQLFDPLTNAKAAVAKYKSQGLGAWTTYTSGAYKKYLDTIPAAPITSAQAQIITGANTPSTPGGALNEVTGGAAGALFSIPGDIVNFFGQAYESLVSSVNFFAKFFEVSTYIRIAAGFFGLIFLFLGLVSLGREARGT